MILLPADDAARGGTDDVAAELELPAGPSGPLAFFADLTAEDFIGFNSNDNPTI